MITAICTLGTNVSKRVYNCVTTVREYKKETAVVENVTVKAHLH